MIIRSLTINNYRSIKDLHIDFPDAGLIGIVGHNGAGKSSILEAIGWVLYGNQAIKSRGKAEGITTVGAIGKCQVSMEFNYKEGTYSIERTLKNATLYSGSEKIATMTSGVNERVASLLNMDFQSFYNTIFTRQGGLSDFIDMGLVKRQEVIERLLGVTKVKDAKITVAREARSLSDVLEGKRTYVQNIGELSKQIIDKELHITELKLKSKELEEKKKKAENAKESIYKKMKNVEEKRNLFQKAKEILINEINKLDRFNGDLKHAKENLSNITSKIKDGELRSKDLMKRISDDVTKELEKEKNEWIKLEEQIDVIYEKRNKITNKQSEITGIVNDKLKQIKRIEKLGLESECPVCLRPLKEHGPNVVTEIKKEIKQTQKQIHVNELKNVEKELTILNSKKNKLSESLKQLEIRNSNKLSAEAALKELDVEDRKNEKEKTEEKIRKIKDEITVQEKAFKNAQSEQTKIDFDEQKYEYIQKERDNAEGKLRSSLEDFERHKTFVIQAEENLRGLKINLEDCIKKKSEIKKDERRLFLLITLEERLKIFRNTIAGKIAPILQNRTGERLNQITNSKYNLVHIDGSYNIQIMHEGALLPLERFSGGEKDAFNLAFRLSISDVITDMQDAEKMGIIVLDEVLGSQDTDRQRSILQSLDKLSSSRNIGQILMVTHIESIKNQLKHVWDVNLHSEKGTQLNIIT